MDWRLVALATVLELLAYFADAWRWMILLEPAGAPTYPACLQSVFVGQFANAVLPARGGELVRCGLLSLKTQVTLGSSITSGIVLRIMDGLWLVILYLLTTWRIPAHPRVTAAVWAFGSGVVILSGLLLFALFYRQSSQRLLQKRAAGSRAARMLHEIHRLGHWHELALTMATGGLFWGLQILAIGAIARADGFEFDFSQVAFLAVVKSLGTVVQLAPGNIGAFQAASAYALVLMLTESSEAGILAEFMFAVQNLPMVIGGAFAVAFTGVRLRDLMEHAHQAHREGH